MSAMSPQPPRYTPELRERAIKMVAEVRANYPSEWAAICAVAAKLEIRSPGTLRRWIVQNAQNDSSAKRKASKWGFLKKLLPGTRTTVGAIIITVVGGLALVYVENFAGVNKNQAQVELDQLSASPGDIAYLNSSLGRDVPFKIDVKLINAGTQIAVVNDARLVIQKFARIPECAAQGSFPATGNYIANMPTSPRLGSVVRVPVSQLAQSDGADRFNVLLRIPPQKLRNEGTVYIYLVRVYIDYNGGNKSVNAGEVLVDLPFDPSSAGAYFYTKEFAESPDYFKFEGAEAPGIERCLVQNSEALRSILSSSAVRTHALAIIPSQLAFCCIARRDGH
jgi:transposase-like protein